MEITRSDSATGGRYTASVDGNDHAGELTYRAAGDNVVIADHTAVPAQLRGRGIAGALVGKLVADARSEGFRIVAQCPYVAAKFKEHPEWSDLLA